MKEQSVLRPILRNLLSGWITIAVRAVIAIVMVPFLLIHLGKEGYGLACLLMVLVGFASVADLGLRSALGRELSEKVANGDKQGFRELSTTALLVYLALATGIAVIGWILAPWLVALFKVEPGLHHLAVWLLRVFGSAQLFLGFVVPVAAGGLTSFMRFDLINTVDTTTSIGSGLLLFATIPLLPLSPLITWCLITALAGLAGVMVKFYYYRKHCFGGRIGPKFVNFSSMRSLVGLGGKMYLLEMTNVMAINANPLVISSFLGAPAVALYKSACKVSEALSPLVFTLVGQLYPLTTRNHVLGHRDSQRQIYLTGSRFTMLLGVLMGVGTFMFAPPFCRLWLQGSLGDDHVVVARIMQVVALVDLTTYARGSQWAVYLGMKRLTFLMWITIPSAVVNLLISIYLVGFTCLGIVGVLYPTIVLALIRVPLTAWHLSGLMGLPFVKALSMIFARPLACGAATAFAAWISLRTLGGGSWVSFGLAAMITTAAWLMVVAYVGIRGVERKTVYDACHLGFAKVFCKKSGA